MTSLFASKPPAPIVAYLAPRRLGATLAAGLLTVGLLVGGSADVALAQGVQTASDAPTPRSAAPSPKASRGLERADQRAPWPEALKHRMSRYARLDRVQDETGDARERVRFAMVRERVQDAQGDRLELARLRLSQNGRLASRNANFARRSGQAADAVERRLSRLTLMRAKADFRRHMLIPAEELAELREYRKGLLRYGDPLRNGRLQIAEKDYDARRLDKQDDTERRRKEQGSRTDERDDERPLLDERRGDMIGGVREAGDEAEDLDDRHESLQLERAEGQRDARLEALEERDAEKQLEQAERAEDRSEESREERNAERRDDKTIRQAEESTLSDD